ncbi:MAG: HpcH/HpaI aldolase/citrate lyase family protein [Oscillospiraceae bacterium]
MLRKGEVLHNDLKWMLKDGKKAIGAWLQMVSPISAEIVAKTGPDFVMVDMEHGPGDLQILISQCQAVSNFGVCPMARAPWNDFVTIKRMLDAGILGILIPYVNTREEAEAAVKACKYPPDGIRGIAGSPRAAGYGLDAKRYLENANKEIIVITQVETYTAVQNLDEILEVDGIDGIFIGPNDLATSMGYLANPSEPKVQEVIRYIESKVIGTGKFLSTIASSAEEAEALYKRGYSAVIAFADGVALGKAALHNMDTFHKMFPDR